MKHKKNKKKSIADWRAMVLSLILAVLVFLAFSNGMPGERRITLPLSVILPDNLKVTSLIPSSAELVISGNEKQIYMIDISKVKLYADFSTIKNPGIASVAVTIDYTELMDYVDVVDISITTDPGIVKLYFE